MAKKDEFKCPVKKIKLGAFDFDIVSMDDMNGEESESLGRFSSKHCHIKLLESQNRYQMADTTLHELLHAIEYVMAAREKAADEENYIDTMASGWGMLFRDNPELIQWLLWLLTNQKAKK